MVATELAQPPPGSSPHRNKIHQQIPKPSHGPIPSLLEELLPQHLLLMLPLLAEALRVLLPLLSGSSGLQQISNEGLPRLPGRLPGSSSILIMDLAAPLCSGTAAHIHGIDRRHAHDPPHTAMDT